MDTRFNVVVAAEEVQPGDLIYDASYYGDNKWCDVKEVRSLFPNVLLDLGHVSIGKHEKEGIAIIRWISAHMKVELRTGATWGDAGHATGQQDVRGIEVNVYKEGVPGPRTVWCCPRDVRRKV